MSFFSFILKNPFRNKTRCILAIIGISIGIATIIALGVVTDGMMEASKNTLKAGGSDFSVTEANSASVVSSIVDINRVNDLKNVSGVGDTTGVIIVNKALNGEVFMIMGIQHDDLEVAKLNIIQGTKFSENSNEIIIGKKASQSLNKTVGDTITLFNREFKIVGIYETGNMWEDTGSFISFPLIQNLTEKTDQVSMIFVKLKPDANLDEVTKNIEKTYPDLVTIKTADDFNKVNVGLDVIQSASWAISLLAILIGSIGVINTMVMSVFERTREIGVLKASGWRNRRIIIMILGESLVLTLVAYLVGIVVGIGAVRVLMAIPSIGNFIQPVYTADVFIRAFLIAVLVGLIGGVYPALRASRLPPTEALRYE